MNGWSAPSSTPNRASDGRGAGRDGPTGRERDAVEERELREELSVTGDVGATADRGSVFEKGRRLAAPKGLPDSSRCRNIMVIYGTRPEAVKVAPLIAALKASPLFEPIVVVTGQHRSMLDQVNAVFKIVPDIDLDIHRSGQGLADITTRALGGVQKVLEAQRPDAVVIQGDTTTVFAAALASFYGRVPVVHLEAGLRTGSLSAPFPEELNRRLVSRIAALHLAPTPSAKKNLVSENVDSSSIVVTGNTVIDALLWAVQRDVDFEDPALAALDQTSEPVILVTAHRRESWGEPLRAVGRALARCARAHPEWRIVFPIHANPLVREAILPSVAGLENVTVTEPLSYAAFARLMDRATFILTDSGGIQEEGPSLGKPVLVLRDVTERPEAVEAGTVRLVGTDEGAIVAAIEGLINDPLARAAMANAVNPYGDGHAARRAIGALAHFFGLGPPPDPFDPDRLPGALPAVMNEEEAFVEAGWFADGAEFQARQRS